MTGILAAAGCVAIIMLGRFSERHNMNPFTLLWGLMVASFCALAWFGD